MCWTRAAGFLLMRIGAGSTFKMCCSAGTIGIGLEPGIQTEPATTEPEATAEATPEAEAIAEALTEPEAEATAEPLRTPEALATPEAEAMPEPEATAEPEALKPNDERLSEADMLLYLLLNKLNIIFLFDFSYIYTFFQNLILLFISCFQITLYVENISVCYVLLCYIVIEIFLNHA